MDLLIERQSDLFRVRLLACSCGLPGCEDVFVLVTMLGAREDLWLGVGPLPNEAAAEITATAMLEDPDHSLDGGLSVRTLVERRLALCGMTWPQLQDPRELRGQIAAWVACPEWMERLPTGKLLAVRGRVFGRDQTRVIRALFAEDFYYVPDLHIDGVVDRAGPLEQPREWGVVDHPLADAPARVEDMRDA